MKKNLPALAVLTLLCGAAYAQSSVTLYGVADVGIGKMSGQKTGMISGNTVNHTPVISVFGVLKIWAAD